METLIKKKSAASVTTALDRSQNSKDVPRIKAAVQPVFLS